MLQHSLLLLGLRSWSLGPVPAGLEFGLHTLRRGKRVAPAVDATCAADKIRGAVDISGTSKGLITLLTYSRGHGQGTNKLTTSCYHANNPSSAAPAFLSFLGRERSE